jgi:hypothetical protein
MALFMNIGLLSRIALLGLIVTPSWAQDPLDSWGQRIVPGLNVNLHAVAFGNGVFVAVGDQSTIVSSSDGVDWVVSSPGAYGNFAGVRFLNGQFVAVGASDKILFSTNGANWTAYTLPSAGFWDVAAGNGVYVLAGNLTYVSTNGIDWVQTFPRLLSPFGLPPYDTALDTVIFGDDVFVALATGGLAPTTGTPRASLHSTNGIDWIPGAQGSPATQTGGSGDLVFANGLFLGMGCGCPANPFQGVAVSTNRGVNWCCAFNPYPTSAGGGALAYGQGYYLFAWPHFLSGRGSIWTSTNGYSWVLRYANDVPGLFVRGATFGRGTFVAVGSQGLILQSGNLGGEPLILAQPQDRGAVVGNPASFSVQVSGEPPLFYQWLHNNVAIPNATNSSYTIASVAATNTGGYKVVITNSFGSVTSRVAQLSVSFLDIKSYAGIEILGLVGRTYRIEATPLNGPVNWQTLTNLVLPSTPYIWIDYESPAVGQRIYRAAELPP